MRLPFEEPDEALALLPLAARRALDHAGLKLSLAGWQSLSFEARRAIAERGSEQAVHVAGIIAICQNADPAPAPIEPLADADALPDLVRARGITPARWLELGALERYALASFARRGKTERLDEAIAALGR